MTKTIHIALAMKPLDGNFAQNALQWGVAGLNIDGCRIGTDDGLSGGSVTSDRKKEMTGDERTGKALGMFAPGAKRNDPWERPAGRFPANIMLIHNSDCEKIGTKKVKSGTAINENRSRKKKKQVYGDYNNMNGKNIGYVNKDGKETIDNWKCQKDCPISKLDEQSGERVSGKGPSIRRNPNAKGYNGNWGINKEMKIYGDKGGASRYFKTLKGEK